MAEIYLLKTPNGSLAPVDVKSAELLQKHKVGQGFKVKIVKVRNIKFLRKFFALLNYAYESWTPIQKEYKSIPIAKDFDQFREDITILAGFYEAAYRIDGSMKLKAKSIAFANMEEEEFERLYSAVIDVLLQRVFTDQTREEVDAVVNNILAYI